MAVRCVQSLEGGYTHQVVPQSQFRVELGRDFPRLVFPARFPWLWFRMGW